MAKNAQNIRNAKSANIEMWPILIPPDDHWPQNMWKTKENTMECLRKNRAEWKSTKKHPKNYFLKTFPKNILFFGQNYPKICTKKDFKKNWLVTYTLGWICSGGSVFWCPFDTNFVTAQKNWILAKNMHFLDPKELIWDHLRPNMADNWSADQLIGVGRSV